MGKFRRSRQGEYLNIGDGKIVTKMALKRTQMVLKHVQTHSYEEKFLNLCLSMGDKEKGQKERPGSLFDDRSEDHLAVSLYLVGSSTGQGCMVNRNQGFSQGECKRKPQVAVVPGASEDNQGRISV